VFIGNAQQGAMWCVCFLTVKIVELIRMFDVKVLKEAQ